MVAHAAGLAKNKVAAGGGLWRDALGAYRAPGGLVIRMAFYFGLLVLDFSGFLPSTERKKFTKSQTVLGFIRFSSLGMTPEPVLIMA